MRALVVAKAPVPGRVKTRLGAHVGMEAAARLAAAALLDTLATCRAAFTECHLALEGDFADALEANALRRALEGWIVHQQRGHGLGERLARAHVDAAGTGPTVQVGMDTPQLTTDDLHAVAEAASTGDAVLGPADGRRLVGARPQRPIGRRGAGRRTDVAARHLRLAPAEP